MRLRRKKRKNRTNSITAVNLYKAAQRKADLNLCGLFFLKGAANRRAKLLIMEGSANKSGEKALEIADVAAEFAGPQRHGPERISIPNLRPHRVREAQLSANVRRDTAQRT